MNTYSFANTVVFVTKVNKETFPKTSSDPFQKYEKFYTNENCKWNHIEQKWILKSSKNLSHWDG